MRTFCYNCSCLRSTVLLVGEWILALRGWRSVDLDLDEPSPWFPFRRVSVFRHVFESRFPMRRFWDTAPMIPRARNSLVSLCDLDSTSACASSTTVLRESAKLCFANKVTFPGRSVQNVHTLPMSSPRRMRPRSLITMIVADFFRGESCQFFLFSADRPVKDSYGEVRSSTHHHILSPSLSPVLARTAKWFPRYTMCTPSALTGLPWFTSC